MDFSLDEYSHLWDGSETGWILVRSTLFEGRLDIFNSRGFMMLVENDALLGQLVARMVEAGCPVVDDVPNAGAFSMGPREA